MYSHPFIHADKVEHYYEKREKDHDKKSFNLAVDIYEETSIYQSKNYKYTAFFFIYIHIY